MSSYERDGSVSLGFRPVDLTKTPRRGRDALLEVLASEGVQYIFGNPGTTELPLMDALVDHPELHYVLALQEATAVAMADGYAQATGRPAFLNLHTSAGLGNAIGNLTNARANGTPLVVTAGNADRRHLVVDPLLSGDLVGLARGVSKWGHEVRHTGELGTVLRRAFNDAQSPPAGPVFVAIPQDVLDEEGDAPVPPKSEVVRAAVAGGLDRLAAALQSGGADDDLVIIAGEEVASSGAVPALVQVAEALGVPVFGSPLHSTLVFPTDHPQWRGPLAPRADAIRKTLAGFRRIFLVGSHAFLVYPYAPGSPLPEAAELIQLAPDAHALARTHPVRLGLAGDPRASLEALLPLLAPAATANVGAAAAGALPSYPMDSLPMHPGAAVAALLGALPRNIAVVDEAITTGSYVRQLHRTSVPGTYFFCRGGGLGWGMPAACGVSLGRGEPVLCVVGDGSAMYSPQALWTAAHERLPVLFAVVNNRQYAILKDNLRRMQGRSAETGSFVAMDMAEPPVDFLALARSMGVEATLVEKASDVGDAAREVWATGRPHLLELPISTP
ncbi:MAG: benzoylformate decarboxylase [Acidimicrobiaceae bacterium]|nr:benzoylformate decarboxylase [Acidimicrobiaceae bacterium]